MAQTPADTAPIAPPPRESFKPRLIRWFYEGYTEPGKPQGRPAHTAPWWKVMCLTGVEGIKLASVFIVTIVLTLLISRALRSTELRVHGFEPDEQATVYIKDAAGRGSAIRIIANRPGSGLAEEYDGKLREASDSHHVPAADPVLFLEVQPGDASEFSEVLKVQGVNVGGHRILRAKSPAIPNARPDPQRRPRVHVG